MSKKFNPQKKPASTIRMLWIILLSVLFTAYYSIRTISTVLFTRNRILLRKKSDSLIRRWSLALLKLLNTQCTVHNHFNFESGKQYIVMCNHSSLYDIPLSFVSIDASVRMVAKKELAKVPLMGCAMNMQDFIFIDRKNREQAIKDLERAKQKMASGIVVWIAPEGTRSTNGQLLPLKPGGFMMALQTGATIVPLGIRGANNLLKKGSWRIMLNHKIDIYFGNPIDAKDYAIEQRNQLIAAVKKELETAAGLN
jgi:1-acyl-sn-glycerol-3-phosphate acyltransferase